jgi:hypothetical protein
MDVVRHKAPTQNAHRMVLTLFNQKITIKLIIRIAKKRLRPTIATLGHMVRDTGKNDACESSHAWRLSGIAARVN